MQRLFVLFTALSTLLYADLDLRIPVVDMKDYQNEETRGAFLDTLFAAMRDVGFFAVRNTGVDTGVVEEGYAQAERFFRKPLEEKRECYRAHFNGQRGFVGGEFAKGNARKDLKEFFLVGSDRNIWPNEPGLEEGLTALYAELERYVIPLQQAIAETINRHARTTLDKDLFNAMTFGGDTLLRTIYYPAMTPEQMTGEPIFWAAAHTDIDLLAILPKATEKGLQVEIDGQWLNVIVPSDAFVVNVGDMLQNLTNGLFKSANHRVLAQEPGKDRFSMVLFVHPRDEVRLDPLPACITLTGGDALYAPGTRQEFLWERLLELNIAPGLLEAYSRTGHTERQLQYGRQSPQVVDMLIAKGLASAEVLQTLKE